VAKVKAFERAGFEMWFNSGDHLPPHFHVEKARGDWEIRVHFMRHPDEMFEIVRPKSPKKRGDKPRKAALREIASAAVAHRAELLQQWQQDVVVKAPGLER
jgi:uncharacterized protein DUF4160